MEKLPRQPLGIGSLITDSFAIFFSNIVLICLIGLVPVILGQVLPGQALELLVTGPGPLRLGPIATSLAAGFLLLCVYTLSTAILVQLAYDEQRGRQVRVRAYLRPAVRALPAIVALSFAITLVLFVSQIVLMLLSAASPYLMLVGLPFQIGFVLWTLAACSVYSPAILFEKAGLHGLIRSLKLTRDYRWPIAGTLALTCALIAVFYLVLGALIYVFFVATSGLIGTLLFSLLSTTGTSILAIAVTLIYARLREIKEGNYAAGLTTVFE